MTADGDAHAVAHPLDVRLFGVVVPVLDEIQRLARCLDALDIALGRVRHAHPGIATRLIVVDDGSTDGSDELAAARAHAELVRSDARNVGAARARGVAELLDHDPASVWIATTDGDSRVPPEWALEHLRHARAGAGAVLGSIRPDPTEIDADALARWGRLNPPGDGHDYVHGANLGIRGSDYLRAGGFHPVDGDEDVGLVERLRAGGSRLVAIDSSPVVTSARTSGRAPDGFARYLRGVAREPVGRGT